MERGEPALVPQWYKLANGTTSNNGLPTSPSKRSDGSGIISSSNNKLVDDTDRNLRRSLSSNGYINRERGGSGRSLAYSSFRRSRDRNQDKDFDPRDRENRSLLHYNGFDYLDSFLGIRAEKDALRRSQSMIAGRPVESWPKKHGNTTNNSASSRGSVIGSISKTSFEKEFPSLRAEGRQGLSDAAGAMPLGLRTAVQSLPVAAPVIIGTSALAEVPAHVEINGTASSLVLQATPISQASTTGSTMTGLNMAEALTQAPSQVGDTCQLSLNVQRIEELTLRKCKQLIPVMPSVPKALSCNLAEKAKSKSARGGDFTSLTKVGQQVHMNSTGCAPTRSDCAKTSQVGNFQVLNREKNGFTSAVKDGPGVGKSIDHISLDPSAIVLPLKSPTDQKLKVDKNMGERKLSSHAQNRNDFFNLLRKKSLTRSCVTPEESSPEPSLSLEKSDVENQQITSPVSIVQNGLSSESGLDGSTENESCLDLDIFASDDLEKLYADSEETNVYLDIVVDPEEEAFLQSLGWDKNAWEEALTKEEIDAFLNKYEKQIRLKIVPEDTDGSDLSGSDV